MPGKLPVCAVLLSCLIAGHTSFADNSGRNEVQADSTAIARDGAVGQSRPANAVLTQAGALRVRVLFITSKDCDHCAQELIRLRSPGSDFDKLKASGWKIGEGADNHIQIVDREAIPELVELLKVREYPTVACIDNQEIIRSFKDGCTTPLDMWTFGWLLKGENERPKTAVSEAARVETTGHYRLRGNHWSIEGDPNPPKEEVVEHLRSPNHANSVYPYGAIEDWSYEELRSLHDDIHEREGVPVVYRPAYPPAANRSLDAFSGSRKATGR